ncbi:hypothetical protein FOY66_01580 [Mycoplasma capricolum subsp. capripneumoniae]|uniref:Uncharacterized protein n=3 Tax=Mycoplasma capricolum TaxID=2095 RepID=A0A9N7AXW7_MYCCC|nr:hypothetical protein [Mycoplasma capricolum]AJK51329.1 hypothetical protein MCCG_0354 [Mycoplasma capricolum subsp. capripneumoniae 87001]AOQ22027.1 hypothetical protein M1601_01575 [Mycoplasma capricolum subsp. capripneumoniae M1601]AQU77427.1 hypothetical protein BVA24_01580 [Mycoplasma capricolum subsp. capripneumoniae]KEY84231.1 hypothetical protein MCCP_8360 [Mycoplasma capricolum subsp. capripneumoniae 99108]KEZ17982.1 Hypothetical protein, predicted transmembrane protein [Mycoplasma 
MKQLFKSIWKEIKFLHEPDFTISSKSEKWMHFLKILLFYTITFLIVSFVIGFWVWLGSYFANKLMPFETITKTILITITSLFTLSLIIGSIAVIIPFKFKKKKTNIKVNKSNLSTSEHNTYLNEK